MDEHNISKIFADIMTTSGYKSMLLELKSMIENQSKLKQKPMIDIDVVLFYLSDVNGNIF
jgi:hypothetical protein